MNQAGRLLGAHWYVPAFIAMLGAVWLLARQPAFMAAGGEAALLIDLCLTAPVLYILCYARRQPLRVTIIRALAIACGGLWLALADPRLRAGTASSAGATPLGRHRAPRTVRATAGRRRLATCLLGLGDGGGHPGCERGTRLDRDHHAVGGAFLARDMAGSQRTR